MQSSVTCCTETLINAAKLLAASQAAQHIRKQLINGSKSNAAHQYADNMNVAYCGRSKEGCLTCFNGSLEAMHLH